jgi:L-arabinonolactonase
MAPRIVARTADVLAEGPVWDGARGRLWWVDIERGLLHSATATGADLRTIRFPERIGSFALRDGGFIVALERGISLCDAQGAGLSRVFANPEAPGTTRFNDGKCDPAGRFYAGTLDFEFVRPLGALYRVGADLAGRCVVPDVCISNGLAWSPDGTCMYFADSNTRRVDRFPYDVESGTPGQRRPFVDTSAYPGVPDGATVSADGRYWLALYDGGGVLVVESDGRIVQRIDVPVRRPTCCAFGGPELRTLFVTCAADEPGVRDPAWADVSVFALDVDAQGLPAVSFRASSLVTRA